MRFMLKNIFLRLQQSIRRASSANPPKGARLHRPSAEGSAPLREGKLLSPRRCMLVSAEGRVLSRADQGKRIIKQDHVIFTIYIFLQCK